MNDESPDDPDHVNEEHEIVPRAANRGRVIPLAIIVAVLLVLVAGGALLARSESATNKVALSSDAKPVTVVDAKSGAFRASRAYVGRFDPWAQANVGPQFVSAYVDTVLVRPGAIVRRGQVLATLDCRNASAVAQAIAMEARSLDAQQKALANEASRVTAMLDGGFVSPNEAEQRNALSASKEAELLAQRAKLTGSSLEVNDCILRAPFDGEVANRFVDPGAFVRPGSAIVSLIDRTTVRMTADVPENDFEIVAPSKIVRVVVYATGREITGIISRRAPAADPATRTVHVEVDIADPRRDIPVGTTAELYVDVGDAVSATLLPISAATIRDTKATIFAVDSGSAHSATLTVLGEKKGVLFVAASGLAAGTRVVTEGRALLHNGDRVRAHSESREPLLNSGDATP